MANTLSAIVNVGWNLGVPIAGVSAGVKAVGGATYPTAVSIIAGNALFGLISWRGLGERGHRYLGGVAAAQILSPFLGVAISEPGVWDHEFEPVRFFVAMTVSIVAQIFLRELSHVPEALRKQKSENGGFSSSTPEQRYPSSTSSEESSVDSVQQGESTQLVEYGKSTSTLLPRWELGNGKTLQSLGDVVIAVTQEEYKEKDLIRGNTVRRKRTMTTSSGGKHTEVEDSHTGWLSSKSYRKSDYKAKGVPLNMEMQSEDDLKIEEVED